MPKFCRRWRTQAPVTGMSAAYLAGRIILISIPHILYSINFRTGGASQTMSSQKQLSEGFMAFCNNCGTKIDSDAKFCEGCGIPIVTAPSVPTAKTAEQAELDDGDDVELDKDVKLELKQMKMAMKRKKQQTQEDADLEQLLEQDDVNVEQLLKQIEVEDERIEQLQAQIEAAAGENEDENEDVKQTWKLIKKAMKRKKHLQKQIDDIQFREQMRIDAENAEKLRMEVAEESRKVFDGLFKVFDGLLIVIGLALATLIVLIIGINYAEHAAKNPKPPVITKFTDSRDGQTYKVATIGKQRWMAENLNYEAEGSKCYGESGKVRIKVKTDDNRRNRKTARRNRKTAETDDDWTTLPDEEIQNNCVKYGRLYDWETAMTACPAGFHLPSDDEVDQLREFVDGGKWIQLKQKMLKKADFFSVVVGKYVEETGTKLKSTSGWDDNGNGTDKFGFSALPSGYYRDIDEFGGFGDIFLAEGYLGGWWSTTDFGNDSYVLTWQVVTEEYMLFNNHFKKSLLSVRCLQD